MKISTYVQNGILHIVLDGEMDEHSASAARRETDRLIDLSPPLDKAYIDLERVTFMDSTGIGFLIGRYKTFSRFGLPVYISNPNRETDKILTLGGIYALLPRL